MNNYATLGISPTNDKDVITEAYYKLAKKYHPDRFKGDANIFKTISEAYTELIRAIDHPIIMTLGDWNLVTLLSSTGITDVYLAESVNNSDSKAVLKISKDFSYNKFLERESLSLGFIRNDTVTPFFKQFVPTLLDSFIADDRQVNVLSYFENVISLEQYLTKHKVEFVHIVWMFNRLASLLGYLHSNKIVHGSCLPCNILIDTREEYHLMYLVDFTCSQGTPYVINSYKDYYPKEIKNASYGTDIYMLAKSLKNAADYIPGRFNSVFDYLTLDSVNTRPYNIWEVQDLWKLAAHDVYGTRQFVKFKAFD